MTIALLGRKHGMTRVFTDDGVAVPVTVIEVLPHRVTQIKTEKNDGYDAIQVTTGHIKRTQLSKAEAGHFAKAGVEPGVKVWEFLLDNQDNLSDLKVGSELKLECFSVGQFIDVTGTAIGKGFAGVIKRHHFNAQDASHGNSLSHRAPGSIGQRQSPGKVFKNKKMAGHLGDVKRTILSQPIVRLDLEKNLLFVRGAVPGSSAGYVIVRPAIKKRDA